MHLIQNIKQFYEKSLFWSSKCGWHNSFQDNNKLNFSNSSPHKYFFLFKRKIGKWRRKMFERKWKLVNRERWHKKLDVDMISNFARWKIGLASKIFYLCYQFMKTVTVKASLVVTCDFALILITLTNRACLIKAHYIVCLVNQCRLPFHLHKRL